MYYILPSPFCEVRARTLEGRAGAALKGEGYCLRAALALYICRPCILPILRGIHTGASHEYVF